MIEVSLYSIPSEDFTSKVGKCIARNRFDKEGMGISIEKFVQGFLKDNMDKFSGKLGSAELEATINSSVTLTRRDISCINYYLVQAGYIVKIFNVTDDEVNATGVPSGEVVEWNVIDHNFIQYDYPTAIKIIPGDGMDIPAILRKIVSQTDLFDSDKFAGLKNPFTSLLDNLDKLKTITGSVSSAITTRLYSILDELGIDVFCATSED